MSEFNLRNYLYNNPLLNEEKTSIYELKKGEVDVINFILGDEEINEVNFSKIKEKLGKALKKGAITFGVLAAVLGSPNISQAQKAELKKDITNSTWFLDSQQDFDIEKRVYSGFKGQYVDNDMFDQDVYNKGKEDRNYNPVSLEKWVNNLGQDSTVYKQYQDSKFNPSIDGGSYTYSNPTVSKTVVNKDVKPWAGKDWSQLTKKGNIGNYLWSKDKKSSITPEVHKELKKIEKGKKVNYRDGNSSQAKQYQDEGFSSSDFQKVDLDNIQSPS